MTKRKQWVAPEDKRTVAELAAEALECSEELECIANVVERWNLAIHRLRQVLHGRSDPDGQRPLENGPSWSEVDRLVNVHPVNRVWAATAACLSHATAGASKEAQDAFRECERLVRLAEEQRLEDEGVKLGMELAKKDAAFRRRKTKGDA